jgi:GTPase SAR1 family protein
MSGLDYAGKGTMLRNFSQDVTFQHEFLGARRWDRVRKLWRSYFHTIQGLIFVFDPNDIDRIDSARQELHCLLKNHDLRDAIILVYANKQDLPNAIKPQELGTH